MPAVMPALLTRLPSSTKIRLSCTRAVGSMSANCVRQEWWVVQSRCRVKPAAAANRAPAQIVISVKPSAGWRTASQSMTAWASGPSSRVGWPTTPRNDDQRVRGQDGR